MLWKVNFNNFIDQKNVLNFNPGTSITRYYIYRDIYDQINVFHTSV